MIDNIHLVANVIPPEEVRDCIERPFNYLGLKFTPFYDNSQNVIGYATIWKNLSIKFRGGYMLIQNSIQKFFKGENYSIFRYSEVVEAIYLIIEKLKLNPEDVRVSRIEFGINLIIKHPAMTLLNQVVVYNKIPFREMIKINRTYGKKAFLSEYSLKLYDKTLEAWLHDKKKLSYNILRVELEIRRTRQIQFVKNFADLLKEETMDNLFSLLMERIQKIIVLPSFDFSAFKSQERQLFFAGQNPMFWNIEKKLNGNTFKKKRNRFNKINAKSNKTGIVAEISDLMQYTYHNLSKTQNGNSPLVI